MAHMQKMADAGLLVADGPIENGGRRRGIWIFRDADEQAIRKMAAGDPTLEGKRLELELFRWLGPAGLGKAYQEAVARDPNAKIGMRSYGLVLLRAAGSAGAPGVESLKRPWAAGKLIAAGPARDGSPYLGVLVFDVKTGDEAAELARQEPHVAAGRATIEVYTWWCSEKVLPDPQAE